MTAFPWSTSPDEIEYAAPLGEPSHVHIPRPSRQQGSHDAKRALAPLEQISLIGSRCACGDD
jgi:hypothetical protein